MSDNPVKTLYTLICPLDTLTGIDMLELCAERDDILLMGCEGGWDSALNQTALYQVGSDTVASLVDWRDSDSGTRPRFDRCCRASLADITGTVLLADLEGAAFEHQLSVNNIPLKRLGVYSSALEELSDFLALPLDSVKRAHAIYHRDYIPGLTAQGVPYQPLKPSDNSSEQRNPEQSEGGKEPKQAYKQQQAWGTSFTQIREKELRIEGNSRHWQETKPQDHLLCHRDFHDIRLIQAEARKRPVLLSRLYDEDCCDLGWSNDGQAEKDKKNAYQVAAERCEAFALKRTLILFTSPDDMSQARDLDPVTSLEYVTDEGQIDDLNDLIQRFSHNSQLRFRLLKGRYSAYLSVRFGDDESTNPRIHSTLVNRIVDDILTMGMVFSRPIRRYSCTFFLPFEFAAELKDEAGSGPSFNAERQQYWYDDVVSCVSTKLDHVGDVEKANEWDAYHYLDPVIREKLFATQAGQSGQDKSGISAAEATIVKEWRCVEKDDKPAKLTWTISADVWGPQDVNIVALKLFRFYNGIYMLAIQVEAYPVGPIRDGEEHAFHSDDHNWWHPLFVPPAEPDNDPVMAAEAERWLRFTQMARSIYQGFITREYDQPPPRFRVRGIPGCECRDGPLIRRTLTDQDTLFTSDLEVMLSYFFKITPGRSDPSLKLHSLHDERMFVNVSYCLAGNPLLNDAGRKGYEALFSLVTYVDARAKNGFGHLGGYAYDPGYTKQLLSDQRYDRWQALGSMYAYTDYSNAYLGFGGEFFYNIAPRHVHYNYQYMLILALFYRASLNHYSRRINDATIRMTGNGTHGFEDFQQIRSEFIRFTNVYWFQDVSSQLQGREIWELQVKGLKLQKEYNFINEEIQAADQFIQAMRADKAAKTSNKLAGDANRMTGKANELANEANKLTDKANVFALLAGFFASVTLAIEFLKLRFGDVIKGSDAWLVALAFCVLVMVVLSRRTVETKLFRELVPLYLVRPLAEFSVVVCLFSYHMIGGYIG